MVEKNYYIYVYLNQLINGKWSYKDINFEFQPFYVGKGRGKRDKVHLHKSMLKQNNFKNSLIKSILKKCGEQPIHYRIYENLTNEEAFEIEKDFIKYFGRRDNQTGILTNGTDGGIGNQNLSNEARKKVGGKPRIIYQYSLDGVFIKKWDSLTSIGAIFKNTGNVCTAIKRNGTCQGYIWSYELKDSLTKKIRFQMPIKYNKINQFDINNSFIKTFSSILEIENELSLRKGSKTKIYECLNGTLKTAYGFKWKIHD